MFLTIEQRRYQIVKKTIVFIYFLIVINEINGVDDRK